MPTHLPSSSASHSITEVTRNTVRRALVREGIRWHGELDDVEFLNRLYDLSSLPSTDHRFDNAERDIYQHRILNPTDWEETWVYTDSRLKLLDGPDELFLTFLAEVVHPVVQPNREIAANTVKMLNEILKIDGWELVGRTSISGHVIYGHARITSAQHAIRSTQKLAQVVDSDYIHRQVNRMESAIESDPDLAIGTAKELIESVCHTILESCGKPVMERLDLNPLVRRALEELKLVPEGIKDEAKGAKSVKSVLGNLSSLTQGLAEIRNLYGTGHGRGGTGKGLSARHSRLAVGAATTLAVFLFETHESRNEST